VAAKKCSQCGTEKDLTQFNLSRGKPRAQCRDCQKAEYRRWKESDLEAYNKKKRASNLRVKYGITPEQYDAALAAQNGGCAICGHFDQKKALAVDHDHRTGALRGLLCDWCNTGLGKLGDDAVTLRRAISYLENPPGIPGTQRKAPHSPRKPPAEDSLPS